MAAAAVVAHATRALLTPISMAVAFIRLAVWLTIRRILLLDEYVFMLAWDLSSFAVGKVAALFDEYSRFPLHVLSSAVELLAFCVVIAYPAYRSSQRLYITDHDYIRKNIPYGNDQILDLYCVPEQDRQGKLAPVLLFVQGGGWTICNKEYYPTLGRAMRRHGVLTVVPNYRTFPRGNMVHMEADILACVQWTLRNIKEYGGDPQRIYLCGQSAGAHLCALVLMRQLEAHLGQTPAQRSSVRGRKCMSTPSLASLDEEARWKLTGIRHFIGISGPYDVPALHAHFRATGKDKLANLPDIFGGRENYENCSPLHVLRRTLERHRGAAVAHLLPPVTLIYATRDKTIPLKSTLDFHSDLRQAAVPGALIMYDDHSHLEPLMEVLEGFDNARMTMDIVRIIFGARAGSELDHKLSVTVVQKSWHWRVRSHVMRVLSPV